MKRKEANAQNPRVTLEELEGSWDLFLLSILCSGRTVIRESRVSSLNILMIART